MTRGLKMGFLDGILTKPSPKVQAPAGFQAPEPKPLTLTRTSDLPSVLRSSLAFLLRLGTGAFVLGWNVDTLFAPEDGKYALPLGPFRIRDSSSVLADAPHPTKPLILYEYDASPFCKQVREMINLLDLTVEYRPCPGARAGKFSQELFAQMGRRTVPYLVDPNTGVGMFRVKYDILT
jgi:glutaredoxin